MHTTTCLGGKPIVVRGINHYLFVVPTNSGTGANHYSFVVQTYSGSRVNLYRSSSRPI